MDLVSRQIAGVKGFGEREVLTLREELGSFDGCKKLGGDP